MSDQRSGPKAIETRAYGYRFRSRLEARWAVFFHHLERDGFRWEYELEGVELPSGRFLPDFYLESHRLWVEVKPFVSRVSLRDLRRFSEFASHVGEPLLLLVGTPGKHRMYLFGARDTDDINEHVESAGREGLNLTEAEVVESFFQDYLEWVEVEWKGLPDAGDGWEIELAYVSHPIAEGAVLLAQREAREARFEFGESPS